MKKNIYTTLTKYLLLILLIITSCTTGSKKLTSKAVFNDSIIAQIYLEKDIAQDKKISMDSLIECMDYITPEFTNESMLSKYDKILFSEEYLFILENNVNNKAVFIFDLDGKYISKVNSIGQGPGEYSEISDFYYDDKNALIGVLSNSQILRYNLNGEFQDKVNLRKYLISEIAYNNGSIYAYSNSLSNVEDGYSLIVFDEDFNPIYTDYPLNKKLINFPLTFNKRTLSNNQKNVFFNAINNDTIYSVHSDYMDAKYIMNFGEYKFPDSNFKELLEDGEKAIDKLNMLYDSKYILFGIQDYHVTDKYLYINFLKNTMIFHSFYSFDTQKSMTFSSSSQNLYPLNVFPVKVISGSYDNNFYMTLDNGFIEHIKFKEEQENISELKDDDPRKIRYNKILKNFDPNNNNTIAVFRLKDF